MLASSVFNSFFHVFSAFLLQFRYRFINFSYLLIHFIKSLELSPFTNPLRFLFFFFLVLYLFVKNCGLILEILTHFYTEHIFFQWCQIRMLRGHFLRFVTTGVNFPSYPFKHPFDFVLVSIRCRYVFFVIVAYYIYQFRRKLTFYKKEKLKGVSYADIVYLKI